MTQSQQHAEDLEIHDTKADAGCWPLAGEFPYHL